MNSQILYNIQQADEIRKLKEERDQLLKIHDKVCNQAAELLKALQILENALSRNGSETIAVRTARRTARAAIQNAAR